VPPFWHGKDEHEFGIVRKDSVDVGKVLNGLICSHLKPVKFGGHVQANPPLLPCGVGMHVPALKQGFEFKQGLTG
jgi:hypothetical protein